MSSEMCCWALVLVALATVAPHAAVAAEALCRVADLKTPNGILLPQEQFRRYACAQCYKFSSSVFFSEDSRWKLVDDVDDGGYPMKLFVKDNMTEADPESPQLLRSFREDTPGADKWGECCRNAATCCSTTLAAAAPTEGGWCPRLWDGWQCWGDAAPGSEQRRPCPDYTSTAANPAGNCSQFASRRCGKGGEWSMRSDYTTCSRLDAERRHSYVLLGAYSVSVTMLVPALAIFCLYQQLHGHRISLHRNLFSSLLLNAMAEMTFRCAVVLSELSLGPSVAAKNGVGCRLLLTVTKYLRSSNYMWMFCEGFHLHRLISVAFASEGSFLVFYLIGWGIPVVPTVVYATLRLLYHDSACWMQSSSQFEWVLLVPNLLSLLVNMVLLADIVRVLVTMLRSAPNREPADYRRAVRATLVLVPLFGVHFVLTLYRPDPKFCVWREVYLYADHLLDGLQGAFVALNFCFLNAEVLSVIKRSYRTLVDTYHPGLRHSRGSHSFTTMQTTL